MPKGTTPNKAGAILVKVLAFLAGVAIIGCVSHYAIAAIGGYKAAGAPLLIALAAGLIVGAIAIGTAWRSDRRALAAFTALALFCGESYALLNTSERTLEQREARLAPVREIEARRVSLTAEIAKAETALAALTTTARIEAATAAKTATETAAIEAVKERACVDRCKARIDASVDGAKKEVDEARAELAHERAKARAKIDADKAALAALPVPATQGILAATIGVDGWKVDLLAAALLSIAANGLGAALVAFASHGSSPAQRAVIAKEMPAPANDTVPVLDPGPGTPVAKVDPVIDWCRAYLAKHGRLPQIPEVQREWKLSKTTAWRRIKAA